MEIFNPKINRDIGKGFSSMISFFFQSKVEIEHSMHISLGVFKKRVFISKIRVLLCQSLCAERVHLLIVAQKLFGTRFSK